MPIIVSSGRGASGGSIVASPIVGGTGTVARIPTTRIAANGSLPGETQAVPDDNLSPVALACTTPACVADAPATLNTSLAPVSVSTAAKVPTTTICSLGLTLAQVMDLANSGGENYSPSDVIALYVAYGDPTDAACLQKLVNAASPAPAAPADSSASAAPACSFALFGDTSCFTIGSTTIGTTTALVLGAALVALLMAFGGKK